MRFQRLILVLTLITSNAFGGAFVISDRTYGTLGDAGKALIDPVFNQMEALVNEALPPIDTSSFGSGIANAAVMSNLGLGLDHSTDFSIFIFGAGLGLGADLGESGVFDILKSPGKIKDTTGAAAQAGIMVGLRPGFFYDETFFDLIDTKRMKLYLNVFKYTLDQLSGINVNFFSMGAHGQYKILEGVSVGLGTLKWNGVDISGGLMFSKMKIAITQAVPKQTVTSTITTPPTTITGAITPEVEFGAETTTFSIPMEASTSARLLYFLSPFVGAGLDLNFGSASPIANVTSDITITDSNNVLGTPTGKGTLELGDSGRPTIANLRGFAGVQFDFGVFGITAMVNRSILNGTIGINLGIKAYW